MTPVLALNGVSRRYRRRGETVTALDKVSLTVAAGETVGLVGPSGSGKSTLARVALALEQPDAGQVLVDSVDLATCRPAALRALRRRWSMVFQDSTAAFNPRARVFDVIADPLRVHRFGSSRERVVRVARLLADVDLDPMLATRPVHAISGGQRQRVAIARALAMDPALIVLDEAVSALDTVRQDRILRLLVDVQRRSNVGYLFISHDLAAVHAIAHRTIVLDRGRVVESGPTGDIVRAPESPVTRALVEAVPALTRRAPLSVMREGN